MSNTTKKFFIFGDPVEHSKSPQMQNSGFEYLNFDGIYEKNHLKDGKRLKTVFKKSNLTGANITVPHKEEAFLQADVVEGIAQKIEAVNTYINKNDKIYAYNTDAPGFLKAIEEFGEINKVLLIGAGGTAKAISLGLQEAGKEVTILNRSASRLEFFKAQGFKTFTWDNFQMNHFDLVVNSTSAGLKDDKLPLNKTKLESIFLNAKYAIDCVYGKETPFVKLAKEMGLKAKDGEDMLLYQGVLAFELFTDTKADENLVEAMRQGLKQG